MESSEKPVTLDIKVTEELGSKIIVETSQPVSLEFWAEFYRQFMGIKVPKFPADDVHSFENVPADLWHHRRFEPEKIQAGQTKESGTAATTAGVVTYNGCVCATIKAISPAQYEIDASISIYADPMLALKCVFEQATDPQNSSGGKAVKGLIEKLNSGAPDENSRNRIVHTILGVRPGEAFNTVPTEEVIYSIMQTRRKSTLSRVLDAASGGKYRLGKLNFCRVGYDNLVPEASAASGNHHAGC